MLHGRPAGSGPVRRPTLDRRPVALPPAASGSVTICQPADPGRDWQSRSTRRLPEPRCRPSRQHPPPATPRTVGQTASSFQSGVVIDPEAGSGTLEVSGSPSSHRPWTFVSAGCSRILRATAGRPSSRPLGQSDSVVLDGLPGVPAGQMAGLSILGAFVMARSCRRAASETGAGSVVQNGVL